MSNGYINLSVIFFTLLFGLGSAHAAPSFNAAHSALSKTNFNAGEIISFSSRVRLLAPSGQYTISGNVLDSNNVIVARTLFVNLRMGEAVANSLPNFDYKVPSGVSGAFTYIVKAHEIDSSATYTINQTPLKFVIANTASDLFATNVALTKSSYARGETIPFTSRIRATTGYGTYDIESVVLDSNGVKVAGKVHSAQKISSTASLTLPAFSFTVPASGASYYTYKITAKNLSGVDKPIRQTNLRVAVTTATTPNPGTFSFVMGQDRTPAPLLARPGLNVPYTDPIFKTTVTRVGDVGMVNDFEIPSFFRHEYSRRPAFNVDSSRFIAISSNGWIRLFSVDKVSNKMAFLKTLRIGESEEPNWHPTNPKIIRVLSPYGADMTISEYNIDTDQRVQIRDFSALAKARFPTVTALVTIGEGRPSNDGNVWCFYAKSGGTPLGVLAYNLATEKILGSLATNEQPDHISTSPLGNFCVPSWVSAEKGTRAYTTDFKSYRQLVVGSQHSDLGLNKAGKEVYIAADYGTGYVLMVDMASGVKQNLFSIYQSPASASYHFSAIGSQKKPGYVAASIYLCGTGRDANNNHIPCRKGDYWFEDKVILISLEANPKIYNLAHTHTYYPNSNGYFFAPTAVSNNDFSRIVFSSSWGATTLGGINDYMIKVPIESVP